MFTRIETILPEAVHKNGIVPQLRRAAALEVFVQEALEIVPAAERASFRPIHLRAGTLTVACKTAAAAIAIKRNEAALVAAVSALGAEPVERIRTLLAPWR